MKILYLPAMFDDDIIEAYYDKGKTPNYAANKYHQLLAEGFAKNGVSVEAYITLPISRANSSRKCVKWKKNKEGNYTKSYISYLNFPVIKHLMLGMKSFLKTLFASKSTVIVYDVLVMATSFGAVFAAKIRGLKCIGIVTDLPMFVDNSKKRNRINHLLIDMADGYILLTKQMNEKVNPKNKPHIVLEGHVDMCMADVDRLNSASNKNVIMYAGALYRKYGVANLVESFLQIAKDTEELHLYGNGEYVSELIEIAQNHPQVIYHGCCPNSEVVKAELNATLLVNPRTGEGEYTKYSFPSKNMEYMASGTPVLCAKLPGIGDEYDDYLYYFDFVSENGLSIALRKVLDQSSEELKLFGQNAKAFVLEEKNHIKQAGKIVQFIRDNWRIS